MSDEEKKARKTKIESNRYPKKSGNSSGSNSGSNSDSNSNDNASFASNSKSDDIYDKDIEDLAKMTNRVPLPECHCTAVSTSTLPEVNTTAPDLEKICEVIPNEELSEAVYKKAVEFEFSVVPIARPITDYKNNFNEAEGMKLTELLNATSLMQGLAMSTTSQATNLLEVCRVMGLKCEQDIRDIIKVSKRLTAFNTIREDDKYVLMKHTTLGLSCLRSVIVFDPSKENFTMTLVSDAAS